VERLRRFYEPHISRLYENAPARARDLDQLELVASRYNSLRELVTDLTLDPPQSTQDLAGPAHLDEDYLTLSTIHSAKGCEWDTVHIIHAADGMIPSDLATGNEDEVEEERRLLYVAMTRAKNRLHIFFPLRYYHRGRGLSDRHSFAQQSRFLNDATLPYLVRRSATSAQGGRDAEIEAPVEPVRIDLDHLFDD
jgi:DNA helicase-2/ATP-dependent DNA helicase PcrA